MKRSLTVFEWQKLRVGTGADTLTEAQFAALVRLNERHGNRFFVVGAGRLTCTGWVGVVEVPGLTLEILPKTDAGTSADDETRWRSILLDMLRSAGYLPAQTAVANLAVRPLRLLDVYIGHLLQAVEALQRGGLAKHYRAVEGNRAALKGQLRFPEHIRANLVQQARFYVRHQSFDPLTPLNALLRMALALAAEVAQNAALRARANALLLAWPETRPVPIPMAVPRLTRRTERYRPALDLALLLLHRLSPDVRAGTTEAVALLFEMPRLFEAYVAGELRRAVRLLPDVTLQTQASKTFWDETVPIRPDVVLQFHGRTVVLDTKWKVPADQRPTAADLQQLYAYCHLWHATEGWLLYPTTGREEVAGVFSSTNFHSSTIFGRVAFAQIMRDGKLNRAFAAELVAQLQVVHDHG